MGHQAIETEYNGYRFRSRLEAKWAVFFDTLCLRWEYEPQGFDLGEAGWYLPDFRLTTPHGNPIWYEIKPKHVESDPKFSVFQRGLQDDFDDYLMSVKSEGTTPRCVLFSGDPLDVLEAGMLMCPRCGVIDRPAGYLRNPPWTSESHGGPTFFCTPCDHETPQGGGHPIEPGMFGLMVRPHKGGLACHNWKDKKGEDYFDALVDRVWSAARIARRSRFEHGEAPIPPILKVAQ